ncbi:MAG: hypothetical protein ACTSVL_00925 [Promethearchaeota archaeon]
MMSRNPQSQNAPYNIIVALKPNYQNLMVHFSTDKSKWEHKSMFQFGPRYYASLSRKFRQIEFYFEGLSPQGDPFKSGSKEKPFSGLNQALMPVQAIHLLEKDPDPQFIMDMNLFAKYDHTLQQIRVDERELQHILDNYPDSILTYCIWVEYLFQRRNFKKCIEKTNQAYQFLLQQDKSTISTYPEIPKNRIIRILWTGGYAAEKANLPKEGIKFLEFGTQVFPEIRMLWTSLGDVLKMVGEMDQCYNAYHIGIKLEPNNCENHRLLIEAYLVGKKWELAKKAIKKLSYILNSIRLVPQEKRRFLIEVQKCYGILEQGLGKPKKARKRFQQGQRIDPNNPFNNFSFAKFELSMGNRRYARELAQIALRYHPEQAKVKEFLYNI